MATIWTLSSTKGGCGKTTLAAILASEIVRNGARVTLVDADPNQPLIAWAAKGKLPDTVRVIADTDATGRSLNKTIQDLRTSSEFVLIDTEGSENLRAGLAMQVADLVIVPSKWSELDSNEALKVADFLSVAEATLNRKVPYVIVPSQVDTAFETANTRQLRASLEAQGAVWLDPPVLTKDAYRAMFTQGCLLQDLNVPANSKSIFNARDNAEAVARAIATTGLNLRAAE